MKTIDSTGPAWGSVTILIHWGDKWGKTDVVFTNNTVSFAFWVDGGPNNSTFQGWVANAFAQ